MPTYEIREWNEDNFDVNIIPYTAEAYKMKKYAFVSDYARFWILYRYGGLYFDTDVEIIRSMDDIIAHGPFMGCENGAGRGAMMLGVAPGLGLGSPPGLALYKDFLDFYKPLSYISEAKKESDTVVKYTTQIMCRYGLRDSSEIQEVAGVRIYPKEYFCPKDYDTGKLKITLNTVSIHHYGASWVPLLERIEHKLWIIMGLKPHRIIWNLKRVFWIKK